MSLCRDRSSLCKPNEANVVDRAGIVDHFVQFEARDVRSPRARNVRLGQSMCRDELDVHQLLLVRAMQKHARISRAELTR